MVKIATRISIGIFVIVCAGVYYLVDWMVNDIRPRYLEALEEPMVDFAHILAAHIEQDATRRLPDLTNLGRAFDAAYARTFSARIYELHKTKVSLRTYVTDRKGIVVFDSEDEYVGQNFSRWRDVRLTLAGEYGARSTRTVEEDPSTSTMYIAAPVHDRKGNIIGVVSVAKPTATIMQFVETAKAKIVTVGVATGLVIIVLSFLLLVWVTQPIARLTLYARQVRDNKKVTPPKLGAGSDIAQLGRAFEEMRDALEGKNYIERYVQTLTHELKSPLSSIKGATELLSEEMPAERRAQFLTTIQKESTRIQHLVDRLLQLSSVEARKTLTNVESLQPAALLDDVLESLSASLQHKGIIVNKHVEMDSDCVVRGERFLLFTALINLLQNAVNAAPPQSTVDIGITCSDNEVVFNIRNTGGHIPDYALEKIFDRFYSVPRPGSQRRGTGLGLPFVREVALLHGGNIDVHNFARNSVQAVLTLPR